MFYIDTSAIVSLLADEAAASRIEAWLADPPIAPITVSDWTLAEVSSALAIKRRTKQLSDAKYEEAILEFRLMLETSFNLLPVKTRHFRTATDYCTQYQTGLRAGDALHLAISIDAGAEIVTLDKRFAAAAVELGAHATLL